MIPLYPPITDPQTVDALYRCHGEPRATDIVAGRDRATAEDLAAWRRLSDKASVAHWARGRG